MTYSYPIILQNQFTPPVQFGDTITTDNAEPGFGYENIMPVSELEIYYYHPDHLGSVSMISDLNGTVSQYIEYIPYGEEMYSAHRNTYNSPYRYNAKELDEETVLYYYEARYYNPKLSIWLSVDPMVEKYISLSPYNYVMNNPIKYIDPDGREPDEESKQSRYIVVDTKTYKNVISKSTTLNFEYTDGNEYGNDIITTNISTNIEIYDVMKDTKTGKTFESIKTRITTIETFETKIDKDGNKTESNYGIAFITNDVMKRGKTVSTIMNSVNNDENHHIIANNMINFKNKHNKLSPFQVAANFNKKVNKYYKTSGFIGTIEGGVSKHIPVFGVLLKITAGFRAMDSMLFSKEENSENLSLNFKYK